MSSRKSLYLVVFILAQKIYSISCCVEGDLYPNLNDCRSFYQCSHGQLFGLQCPEGLHFNPTVNVCDFPENVNCDAGTTLSETTTTEIITSSLSTTTTRAPTTTTTTAPTTTPVPQKCQWEPGQEIRMGNRCDISHGFFVFQFDGNAVIYDNNNVALWNTQTGGGKGHTFVFQTDGNLVMYSSTGSALWHSSSHNQGGNLLVFQEDRNLVIYNSAWVALWYSRTQVL